MTSRRPTTASPPLDDLTQVHGIGAVTAQRLRDAGITTFEVLARTAPAELSAILEGTVARSPQRITDEGWTTQAASLATTTGATPRPAVRPGKTRPARYSFMMTLFVDVTTRHVLSCTVLDGQTDDTVTLPGWDVDGLTAYLTERASLTDTPPARRATEPSPTPGTGAEAVSAVYPFARGTTALPPIEHGLAPGSVHVQFDPASVPVPLPERSYAVVEVHDQSPTTASSTLGRATTELDAGRPVDIDVSIVVPTSKAPIDGQITLWIMAPGPRPASHAAKIPTLNVVARLATTAAHA